MRLGTSRQALVLSRAKAPFPEAPDWRLASGPWRLPQNPWYSVRAMISSCSAFVRSQK